MQLTKNDLKNYIITAIITLILTIISVNVSGLLGLVFPAFIAAFIGYSATRHHYLYVGLLCGLVIVVFGLFGGTVASLLSGLPVILCGISLGICYNLKFSQYKTLFIVTLIYVLYMIINMKISGLASNLSSVLTEMISAAYPLYEGMISQTDYNAIASQILSIFIRFMPAFIVVFCAAYGFLLLIAFKSVLKKTTSEYADFISFSRWHAEKSLSIAFLILLGISMFLPANNILTDAIANVVFVSSFMFFVFGFSFLTYILKIKAKNPASGRLIAVIILAVSVIFMGFPFMILSVIGVMDGIVDYREKLKK